MVGLKWVGLRPEVDPLTGVVGVDTRFSGASPADRSALEWALRFTVGNGGSVTVVTAGPPEAETMLREALAVGAERAVRIADLPAEASSRWVARELALMATGNDLVFCGHASLDRGSGAVPAFVAHELNWAQALGLIAVGPGTDDDSAAGDQLRRPLMAERRLDGGRREQLAIVGAAVLSFEAGPDLRRAPLASALAAKTAIVETRPAVGFQPSADPVVLRRGPYRPPARVKPAPQGSTRDRLASLIGTSGANRSSAAYEVSPAEAAQIAVTQLIEWGYLDLPSPTLGGESEGC